MLSAGLLAAMLFPGASAAAQAPASPQAAKAQPHSQKSRAHRSAKKKQPVVPVALTPAPPPMPNWPVNDKPNPASVMWDANGLRINASNSSLQQILNEVSTETGSKVEGPVPDQRVYGDYGPGQARDVLSQLLQGYGYNLLLSGDLGQGAPREIVLSPRRTGAANSPNAMSRPQQQQQEADEDIPEQPEEQPAPPLQAPQLPNNGRPGFGPNGPIRTPQQVMEEMQQRQIQQQQQLLQQPQPGSPPTNPQ
jgi:hypothetical protein